MSKLTTSLVTINP